MIAAKRDLVGRKIIGVDFQKFSSLQPLSKKNDCTDPLIFFDNGRQLYFVVQETEVGCYGVEIGITASNVGTAPLAPECYVEGENR